MSEGKQRSGVFKFFYIVLSIITFPIFVILFILRHPFWTLFVLCLIAGGATYYPISRGVKPEEVIEWYQKKYQAVKFEFVSKAVESGDTGFIPQVIVDEVVKTKQKMEEEKQEAARPKSENYNENISRDKKVEEITVDLKKRKGGFKKKSVSDSAEKMGDVQSSSEKAPAQENQGIVLDVESLSAGGLADLLGASGENSQDASADQENVGGHSDAIFSNENESTSVEPKGLQEQQKSASSPKEGEATSKQNFTNDTEVNMPPMLPTGEETNSAVMSDMEGAEYNGTVSGKFEQHDGVEKPNAATTVNEGKSIENKTLSKSSTEDDVFSDEDFKGLELF